MLGVESKILEQITGNCLPGSEKHVLTLLKSGGFLEIDDDDRISIKITARFNFPKIVSLGAGLPELIRQQFPCFVAPQKDVIAPPKPTPSKAQKIAEMTDDQLLLSMEDQKKWQNSSRVCNLIEGMFLGSTGLED